MIIVLGVYTYYSFHLFRYKNKGAADKWYGLMTFFIFIIHFTGYSALYLQIPSEQILILYGSQVIVLFLILAFYQAYYPKLNKLLLRNMMMLLVIGFILLGRLSYDKAVRQVIYTGLAATMCMIVPIIFRKILWIRKFGWIFGILSIAILALVLVLGETKYGATNWIMIRGFGFQPSEFVKILYVLCIASLFEEGTDLKRVMTISVMAGAIVLMLVIQKDLGAALIFFVTYVFMLFVASSKIWYLVGGLAGGSLAAVVAYYLFGHVKVRVLAWKDPFSYIDKEGYQITQSLFAIGTGGWLGMGLNQGMPTSIPVVDSDFIFSAIVEELGGIFSIFVIMIYISCFLLIMDLALKMNQMFYRLVSMGFAVMIGFQVFLSIGGVIKFIPSTGVTLPLISAGGSSLFATIIMFMIVQGIYMKTVGENHKKKAIDSKERA